MPRYIVFNGRRHPHMWRLRQLHTLRSALRLAASGCAMNMCPCIGICSLLTRFFVQELEIKRFVQFFFGHPLALPLVQRRGSKLLSCPVAKARPCWGSLPRLSHGKATPTRSSAAAV
eukprot:scaffold906_cov395-Prasinococcus_capsulatus_cf.AAC.2